MEGSSAPSDTALTDALLALCEAIARGRPWSPPETLDLRSLDRLQELAARHTLTPIPPVQAADPIGVPPAWPSQGEYHRRIAANLMALRQIEEIAVAFAARSRCLLALKGAATLLWLYTDRGARRMADLDFLIEADAVAETRAIMASLGYEPIPNRSSIAEEEALLRHSHMRPYRKEDRLPVEFHVALLQARGDDRQATRDAWRDAVPVACGGATVWRLSREQFLLHTIAQYAKDLDAGFASLHRLVDLLHLLFTEGDLDWSEVRARASLWAIEAPLGTVLATLNRHWNLGLLCVPGDARPLSIETLIHGRPDAALQADRYRGSDYLQLLRALSEVPGARDRLRILLGFLFPSPEKLRYWHEIPSDRSLAPYYARHLVRLVSRFGRGVVAITRPRRTVPPQSRDDERAG